MWRGDRRRRQAVVLAGGLASRDGFPTHLRPAQRSRSPSAASTATPASPRRRQRPRDGRPRRGPGDPPASTAPPAGTAASGRSRWSNSACCRDMGWRDCPPSGPRNGPVVRAGGGLPARASPHAPPQPLLPIRPATDVTQLPPPWRSSRIATAPRLPLPWGAASSGLSVCRRVLPQSAAGGHPRVEAEHLAPRR
jgi:hypothetical protein